MGTCDPNSCFVGYARFNSTYCLRCLNGCSSCNSTAPFNCIGCLVGSYSSMNGNASICSNCDYGCGSCSGPNACFSCLPNFQLADGQCTPLCFLPCVVCGVANSKQVCQRCLQGYSLQNGSCTPDFSCAGPGSCEFCPLGYFPWRGSCQACQSNCDFCTLAAPDPAFTLSGSNYLPFLTCGQCTNGYFLDSTSNCLPCSSACLTCTSSNLCAQCKLGHFL